MKAPVLSRADSRQFYRLVASLVVPMALQNLINVAVTSADVLMLGRVSETVLSAASLAGQVQFVMTLFFFGLTSGASVLTAQYWGKGDTETIEKVMGISMRFSLLLAALFSLTVLLIPEAVMRIFTTEEPVIQEGAKYLRLVSPSYLFMSISMVYLNIMRTVERVVVSTVVYFISLVSNIIGNAILIFGLLGAPKLGIAGAAIATSIARFLELLLVFFYSRKVKVVRLRMKNFFVRDKALFRDFLRYSVPVTLNELLWGAGVATIAIVIGHMGSPAVAANSVAQVTRQLATVVAFGIASAAAIMIGKALGSGNEELAEVYGARFLRLTLIFGFLGSGVVLLVRPVLLQVMNLSGEARGYLSFMLFVMAYFVIGQALNTTMIVGIFRGGGDTKFGLFMDVLFMWGVAIAAGALCAFVFHWPVEAVFLVLTADEILKLIPTYRHYRTKIWLNNVTR